MPLKIKNIDFSCASPSSTAICSSTNQHSMVKNTTKSSFNRLNSYLNDHYKTFTNNNNNNQYSFSPRAPCINELPFTPRLSSSYREKTPKQKPSSIVKPSDLTPRRKSSADIADIGRRYREKSRYNTVLGSPPRGNSSRYLLGESRFLDSLSENNNVITKNSNKCDKNSKHNDDAWALVPSTPIVSSEETSCEKKSFGSYLDNEKDNKKINKSLALVNPSGQRVINSSKCNGDGLNLQKEKSNFGYSKNDSIVLKKASSGSIRTRDQVVVLRVSLHCRGCEGKLRKHLSKMEGVTSFSIDLETKKVTVIGNVTPLGVLTSISKVKNAQFWPSQASTSPSSSSSSSTSSTLDFN